MSSRWQRGLDASTLATAATDERIKVGCDVGGGCGVSADVLGGHRKQGGRPERGREATKRGEESFAENSLLRAGRGFS